MLRDIVDGFPQQWPAFGYIAAEADLARVRGGPARVEGRSPRAAAPGPGGRRGGRVVSAGTRTNGSNGVTSYLISTGTLFSLVAVAHVLRTIAEWSRLSTDPGFIIEGPGLGVLAGAIAIWAWRLLSRTKKAILHIQ